MYTKPDVENIDLSVYSVEELEDLIQRAQLTVKEKREADMKELRRKAQEMADSLGMDVAEIMGIRKQAGGRRRKPARKAKIKYRNPENPEQTWTGRGMRPVWLREKLENGARLEDFKID